MGRVLRKVEHTIEWFNGRSYAIVVVAASILPACSSVGSFKPKQSFTVYSYH
jgi:hypothetical protein